MEARIHQFATEQAPRSAALPRPAARIEAIDFARGLAVTLMILSHGVKGLLTFEQIPTWGLVPIHLITKFSSTLFILVFGIAMSVAFLPAVGTARWPEKRKKLLLRGIVILFWYKVLTIVEMIGLYSREDVLDTLLYRAFPVYVEILGFYAIALLWVPFILPLWARLPLFGRVVLPIVCAVSSHWLYYHFDFWGMESLKAILVEHEDHYTWGQLARAPLIFVGLILGDLIRQAAGDRQLRWVLAVSLVGVSAALFLLFFWTSLPSVFTQLVDVAKNAGKHPPEADFMLFSLGGALLILGATVAFGERLARILRPITIIGQNSLQAFIFHIFVIFVFYRYLFDYWHKISYQYSLFLTALLIGMTALWIKVTYWVREKS